MTKIHVVCHRPGLHRGGRSNPAHAVYDIGEHTPAQLRELLGEPEVRVVIGHALTEPHIVKMEQEAQETQDTKLHVDAGAGADKAKSAKKGA